MRIGFKAENNVDEQGRPAGGSVELVVVVLQQIQGVIPAEYAFSMLGLVGVHRVGAVARGIAS